MHKKALSAAILGNILSHYDRALFGLLAPFIAPLFFATQTPLTALLLTYGIMPLSLLTKPIGSLFFGWFGDRFGTKTSLLFSLFGMALVSLLKGFLPTASQIGALAPCLLASARMLQGFCAAGQTSSASIFILENTQPKNRSLVSSFYDVSSMSGLLFASALVTLFSTQGWIETGWRLLFWIGGLKALLALFLRLNIKEKVDARAAPRWGLFQTLKTHRRAIFSVAIASGFSYVTYACAFTLMNGYVPLITSLSRTAVMKVNTLLLIADMVLLPFFGLLSHRFGKEKVMLFGALFSSILAIPLFSFLDGATLATVVLVRFLLVFFGVAFAAPYHAWKLTCVPKESRYTVLSFGCTLGSQLFGSPACVICLGLYRLTGCAWAPGVYLALLGFLAGLTVHLTSRNKLPIQPVENG